MTIPANLLDSAFGPSATPKFSPADPNLTTPAARNNNPGNLRSGKEWQKFASPEEGFNALIDDISAKQAGRTTTGLGPTSTLSEFFGKYAPQNDNNDTVKYTKTVADRLGVTPDTPIGGLNKIELAKAIAAFEDHDYWNSINGGTDSVPQVKDSGTGSTIDPGLLDAAMGSKAQHTAQAFIDTLKQIGTQPADASAQHLPPLDADEQLSGMRKAPGESRLAFMERSAPERKLQADLAAVNAPSTIGPAPTGWRAAAEKLGNIKLLSSNGNVISTSASPGGLELGSMFRFGDQLLTPTVGELAKGNVMKSFDNFINIGGEFAKSMVNPLVTMPANLMVDYLGGNKVLLPEERTAYVKSSLANYAGIFLGLEAGGAYEASKTAMFTAGRESLADIPMSELMAMGKAGTRNKLVKGYVEGAAGGAATGFLDAPKGEDRASVAMAYGLMAAPLGAAFEMLHAVAPGLKDAPVSEQAAELYKLKQYQAVKDADQAVESMKATAEGDGKIEVRIPTAEAAPVVTPSGRNPVLTSYTTEQAGSAAERYNHHFSFDVGQDQPLELKLEINPHEPTTARVNWIGAGEHDLSSSFELGPKGVRSVLRQVREKLPDVTRITGERITGARAQGERAFLDKLQAGEIAGPLPSLDATVTLPDQHVSLNGKDYSFKEMNAKGEAVVEDNHGVEQTVPPSSLQHLPTSEFNPVAVGSRDATTLYKDFRSEQLTDVFDPKDWTLKDHDITGAKALNARVLEYAKAHDIPADQVEGLASFLSDKFGEDIRKKALTPEENALYNRLVHSTKPTGEESLVDLATANNLYVENHGGGITLKDVETDKPVIRVSSPARAKEFLTKAGAGVGPDLDSSGGALPPGGTVRGVSSGSIPPDAHGSDLTPFEFRKDGPLRQFTHWLNTTWIGLHTTRMRQIMVSLDAQLGTEFFAKVWNPLNRAFTSRNADMHPDVVRLASAARMARAFTQEEYEHATNLMETMSPEDMVKKGGLFKDRAFTPRETTGAEWFAAHNIDIPKAFAYRRALRKLEQTLPDPDELGPAVAKLKETMGMDADHEEAARIIGTVLFQNQPDQLSMFGIARLANATMHHELSPEAYIKENNLSPLVTKFVDLMREHYQDLGKKAEIPDEAMLNGYFPHYRNYGDDAKITTRKNGVPIFVSDLLRTGEMNEYDRDPISVMMRYITSLANDKHVKGAWNEAQAYLDEGTRGMGDNGRTIKDLLQNHYMDKIRGVPHDATKLSQGLWDKMTERLGIKTSLDTRRDLTNTALSISSAAVMGARVSQGLRDMQNIVSIFYSRFGAGRTADMLTQISKWTPQMLEEAGIIERAQPGEGVTASLQREGVTPTLSPVATQSAQERAQSGLTSRVQASAVRDMIQRAADNGIKWGLQHNVYQWGHAAAYLEGRSFTSSALTDMVTGKLTKEAAYNKLKMNTYDLPVAQEFDRLVREGKYEAAADFMGHANSYETISMFGYGDTPVGWNTNGGRMLAQLGSWSVWARSQVGRMLSRGSAAERTAAMTRFAMTQTATKAASAVTGLNLSSWYLPFAAPLFAAGSSLSDASREYDVDKRLTLVRNALLQASVGEIGSGLFAGGPAASFLQSAAQLGRYDKTNADALSQLGRSWMLGVPFSFAIKDLMDATAMARKGVNPINSFARAIGIRSNPESSPLNPFGIPK